MKIYDLADWFLSKETMTHKKLQKLCYYAEAWSCALFNRGLIEDSHFEAWVHGPVSPELYQKYKDFYWMNIPSQTFENTLTEEENDLLESVWLTYGDKSANELEGLTYTETPWCNARSGLSPNEQSHNIIKFEDMRDFYRSIYIGD